MLLNVICHSARLLKKTVAKDSNVVNVALAVRVLGALANGVRKPFAPIAIQCLEIFFDKFREKKTGVVVALPLSFAFRRCIWLVCLADELIPCFVSHDIHIYTTDIILILTCELAD